ncbi:DMT family transporter [uncultured Shimia sp.]|uniref:DMT family transporter n=1 Tax=uncultured Shimia sp. TaxID=573152 RepID=UPI00261D2A1B|nr:DMT family transporter [uncultured Shimia sp.]
MTASVNNRPVAAALSMLSAMATIGFIDNFVGEISAHVSVWQFIWMRSTVMFPLLILMSLVGLGTLWAVRWRPVLARATIITCAMVLYFGSLGLMPITQALAGLFTSPIWVLLINLVFMRRRIGPWRIAAVFIGFAGILLVLQPGTDGFGLSMLMPVAAGLFYAVSSIATRSWCAGESALALLGTNMAVMWVVGGLATLLLGITPLEQQDFLTRSPSWEIWPIVPYILLQAVGSLTGVFLIIRAYQMDEPTNVAVFEYSVMLFGPVFAFLLFGQGVNGLQAIGIAMIAASGVIIAIRSK